MNSPRVAVIGAGVVGLSTTLAIEELIPLASITIFTDRILDETLSSVAGGIFRPHITPGQSIENVKEWLDSSWGHFKKLASSPKDSYASGVRFVSGQMISSQSLDSCLNPLMDGLTNDMTLLSEAQLSKYPSQYRFGSFHTTIIADPRCYMRWMLNKILRRSNLVMKKLQDLENDDSLEDFDVIVNCTGMGSKTLMKDKSLIPIRGQTIRVYAPWISQFLYADTVYIIPATRGYVTLGGIKQFFNDNTSLDKDDRQWIWKKCLEVCPSLKDATIVSEHVGLRPYRPEIRVEQEVLPNGRQIVHNYGHGGNGIALSYGTAREAASLVKNLLESKMLLRTRAKL
jgi:glycine/D-amino acid oxidase-like deaminating enzyme